MPLLSRSFCFALQLLILLTLFVHPAAAADVSPEAGMLRYPHVSRTHITFVYGNDIWTVPREGGVATPLASPPGQEVNPRFSPDGTQIAFVGNYDGQRDIYVMPVGGGIPHRITYHPGNKNFTGWTSDGRLIYSSGFRTGIGRAPQIYTISSEGGMYEQLPVPYGDAGAISPDGQWLAYTPHNRDRRTWKRYRGGFASNIWLFNLNDHSSRQVTDWEGTDTLPMWSPDGRTLYFLSDAGDEHRLNIWSYDLRNGRRTQVTRFRDWDVKWPSMGPGPNGRGEIVFQNGPSIYLLNLTNNQSNAVQVRVPGARPNLRPRAVDVANFIQSWDISPSGKRVVVQARGDVWTLPAENGAPRNLTRTSGIAERTPAWSPDGRWLAYFSDETSEYELYIMQSDGRGETRQLTHDGGPFKYNPTWSPDSKHILFRDKTSTLYMTTLESGETRVIDYDEWGLGGRDQPTAEWSHDSRWLTFAKQSGDRPVSSIWLYNVEADELHQVTSGMFNDGSPVFDRQGDWLFYTTIRSFNPTYSNLDTTFAYTNAQVLVAVPLRDDVKSPWLPESDEQEWKDDEEAEEEENGEEDADDDNGNDEAAADDGVSGTWEGTISTSEMGDLNLRMVLALASDNSVSGSISADMFSGTISGSYSPANKSLTLVATVADMPPATMDLTIDGNTMTGTISVAGQSIPVTMQRVGRGSADDADAGDAEKPREEVKIDIEGFERRAMMLPVPNGNFGQLAVNDKNQLLFVRHSSPGSSSPVGIKLFDLKDDKKQEQMVAAGAMGFVITADGKKILIPRGRSATTIQNASAGATGTNVPTGNMIAQIDPRAEWEQVFTDAWRIQRDFFYVDNLHGVDWVAVRDHYRKKLADAASREDVSFIIGEMIAELNVGHAYYWGGDIESEPSNPVAQLGVDFALENGAYRIERIYRGADWDVDVRGPLTQPGVDVKEGDYLLAVNGVPMDTSRDPFASFQHVLGRAVTLTVSENPQWDDDARDVVIEPARSEASVRYRAWIERNRRYVEEQTDGQVGYIYVPDTGVNGQNDLVRQYFGQLDKKAIIIDERWNGGGQIPTRFIEMLNRPITNYWARRDNRDWPWPPDAHQGPKCMLINGPSGSGGDAFPHYFKQAGLGKLIGTRTWGGLVGISGNPTLIDGGYTAVPTFGYYTPEGRWSIEGHGVDPDIEVMDDPALMVNGGDPQLDAAIRLMLEEIQRNVYTPPARPAPPVRSGFGIAEDER